ncbi:ankyrin, partial [Piromyces finnis]
MGANINFKDQMKTSLLITAIQEREYLILSYLLKQSIHVNKRDIGSYSHPLIKAIGTNNIDIVMSYIEKVFSENNKKNIEHTVENIFSITSCDGFPPLILSYLLNRKEITDVLMNRIMVNTKDYYGYSLMHYAILKRDINTIKILIHHQADINNDKYTNYALDTAIKIQDKEIFSILMNCDDIAVDQPNEFGDTPLLTLIKNHLLPVEDKKEMLELLLKKEDCDINFIEKEGNTTLIYAIIEGHLPIIKLLIDYGAEINEIYDN